PPSRGQPCPPAGRQDGVEGGTQVPVLDGQGDQPAAAPGDAPGQRAPSFRTQRVQCDSCGDSRAETAGVAFAVHVVLRVAFRTSCVMGITVWAADPMAEDMCGRCDMQEWSWVVAERRAGR